MSTLFYSVSLYHVGDLGWTTQKVSFAEGPVTAHFMLSGYSVQNDQNFVPFEERFAYAYIQTPETPTGLQTPNAEQLTANSVWVTAEWLTFQLEGQNVTTAAVGVIFDRLPDGVEEHRRVVRAIDLALYDEDGVVHGTYRDVQLEGGRAADADEVRELALAQGQQRRDQVLRVTEFDRNEIPVGVPFRIDPRTGRAQPL